MKLYLILQYSMLSQNFIYLSDFQLGKSCLLSLTLTNVHSLPFLSLNFNVATEPQIPINGYILIFILIVGIIGIFFLIKFLYNKQIRLINPKPSGVNVQLKSPKINEIKSEVGSKVIILEETEQRILDSLKNFEDSNHFNQKEISLYNLAHEINTNTKYLSNIIKKHKSTTFNNYINELRIKYIVDKLKNNPAYLNYKISHLADEVGFSSHSAFSSVFYQLMGIKPSIFIKNLKDEMNHNK